MKKDNVLKRLLKKIKDFCIEYDYITAFIAMTIVSLIQPIIAGSGIIMHIAIFICIIFTMNILSDHYKWEIERERKFILRTSFLVSVFLLVLCYNPLISWSNDDFHFNKESKIIPQKIFINYKFIDIYKDVRHCPKKIYFTLTTNDGDYEMRHFCIAHIDIGTWKKFNLDEKNITTFIRTDAEKRLRTSFSTCRLQEVVNCEQYYFYKEGVFYKAELRQKLIEQNN